MLSNNNQSLNKIEKMVLTVCLISAVLLTAAFSKAGKEHDAIRPKSHKSYSSVTKVTRTDSVTRHDSVTRRAMTGDTDIAGMGVLKVYKPNEVANGSMLRFTKKIKHQLYLTYLFKKEGVLYQYTALDNGNNATYYVNGSALPEDKMAEYKPKFDRLMSEMDRMESPKEPAGPGELQHNGGVGEIVDKADSIAQARTNAANYKEDSNEEALAPLNANMNRLTIRQALDSMKLKAMADSKGSLNKKQMALNGSLTAMDTVRAMQAYKYKLYRDSNGKAWVKKPIAAKYQKEYDKSTYKAVKPYKPKAAEEPGVVHHDEVAEPAEPASAAGVAQVAQPAMPPSPVNTVGDKITKQLIDEHLIRDKNNYSFKITDDALYIDGVKQSDKVHEQVIKNYVKPGDHINFTRTNKTTN
jgi:hypothetical protein